MGEQGRLFPWFHDEATGRIEPSVPFIRDSETSKAAAEAFRPRAVTKRDQVLEYIRSCGATGATDNEIGEHFAGLRWSPNTHRPRRVELCRRGEIELSGDRDGCWVWRAR